MAIFRELAGPRRRTAQGVCLLLFLLCLSGCRGCRKTPETEELEKQRAEEKAKKKEKEPFEAGQPLVMPTFGHSYKPGHWICQVWPGVKANRGEFQGELQTQIVDEQNRKVPLPGVPYEMTTERPVALAKEQAKSLESFTWIPPGQGARSMNFKLAAGGGGPVVSEGSWPLSRMSSCMKSYCYYFVVLSRAVGRYDYINKKLASIHLRSKHEDDAGGKYYEVVTMSASRRPSLPSNALYWTSIAYLLWDDFDPAQCDVDQQRALVDWLHWGGQILVSGPDALEQLRNSFLRPYLPATVKRSRTFAGRDLEELGYWDWSAEVGLPPNAVKPWPGAELEIDRQHARYLPYTGDLLVERQVGRGRIVASAFRLTGPELIDWPGFDCMFNACLLRRQAREFQANQDSQDMPFLWSGSGKNASRFDAAQMTAVRYFSRDTGVEFEKYASDILGDRGAASEFYGGSAGDVDAAGNPVTSSDPLAASDDNAFNPFEREAAPGLGAWNDSSPVAQAARTALKNAAGISVPGRNFVLWVVAGYLCVLVPLNWLFFRLLGRVEWAWFAAPLIAIACTVVVIHQAQLNIGFARSQNEITVVEMQPGYSRAHVTRYAVFYTSLATRYEFRLGDPCAQILPFPGDAASEETKRLGKDVSLFQTRGELICRRAEDTQLTGFKVASNDIDFVHSEEMADFGGTVSLHRDSDGGLRVTNGTAYPLDDCRAVRGGRSGGKDLRIGRLEPGASSTILVFKPDDRRGETAAGNSSQSTVPSGELSIEAIAEVALHRQDLRPEGICLLARIDGKVAGLTVIPATPQTRQAALLVAHLDAGRLPTPKADRKLANSSPQAKYRKAEEPNDDER